MLRQILAVRKAITEQTVLRKSGCGKWFSLANVAQRSVCPSMQWERIWTRAPQPQHCDTWGWVALVVMAVLCIVRCSGAPLVSTYNSTSLILIAKNVSRHCWMAPGGQNTTGRRTHISRKKPLARLLQSQLAGLHSLFPSSRIAFPSLWPLLKVAPLGNYKWWNSAHDCFFSMKCKHRPGDAAHWYSTSLACMRGSGFNFYQH
jgi:hypothetical protein